MAAGIYVYGPVVPKLRATAVISIFGYAAQMLRRDQHSGDSPTYKVKC